MSMKPRIAVLLLILIATCLWATGCTTPPADNAFVARDQVRILRTDSGNGSGVVIAPGFVLTAQHVATHPGLATHVKGAAGVVLALGKDNVDLGLLHFPRADTGCPCAKLAASEARLDEVVYIIGYPFGIAQVLTVGRSQGVEDHVMAPAMFGERIDVGRRLVMTAAAAGGNSGGGVFVLRDGEFQLVGILVEGIEHVTFAIPLADIKPFLEANL